MIFNVFLFPLGHGKSSTSFLIEKSAVATFLDWDGTEIRSHKRESIQYVSTLPTICRVLGREDLSIGRTHQREPPLKGLGSGLAALLTLTEGWAGLERVKLGFAPPLSLIPGGVWLLDYVELWNTKMSASYLVRWTSSLWLGSVCLHRHNNSKRKPNLARAQSTL